MRHFRPLYILLITLLVPGVIRAQQDKITVKGSVQDAETGEPLVHARVVLKGTNTGVLTDKKGQFEIHPDRHHKILSFSYLGYERYTYELKSFKDQVIHINLEPNPIGFGEVVITDKKPRKIQKELDKFVFDYAHLGENLLVLNYDYKSGEPQLVLLSPQDSILARYTGPEKPGKLVTDCLGNVHVLGDEYACQLDCINGRLYADPYDRSLFEQTVLPCIAHLNGNFYFKSSRFWGQEQMIYFKSEEKREAVPLTTISNKQNISHLAEDGYLDLKHTYANADIQSAVEAYTIEELKQIRGVSAEVQFLQKVRMPPLFLPLIPRGNLIHLFDHQNNVMLTFDQSGELQDELPISYHNERNWKPWLFSDPETGNFYTTYEKGGITTLARIDEENGGILEDWKIPFQFISDISVKKDVVYFLYKPSGERARKRLYKWHLH